MEGEPGDQSQKIKASSFGQVIVQILIIGYGFSVDSIITAIGMVKEVLGNVRSSNSIRSANACCSGNHIQFCQPASGIQDACFVVPFTYWFFTC
jgi:hypothetical protein